MRVRFTGIKGVGMAPLRQGFEGRGGKRVHFTGIKGVGMAALALAYQDAGWEVTGSDTKDWQITDPVLADRGIKVVERFTPRNIWVLKKMIWVPAIDKLIYTGAHHGAQNVEVKWAASRGVPTLNYARALGEFFADKKQIVVCGVGGKTTTAGMIATILYNLGEDSGTADESRRHFFDTLGSGSSLTSSSPLGQDKSKVSHGSSSIVSKMSSSTHPGLEKAPSSSLPSIGEPSWIIGTSEVSSLPAAGKWGNGEWVALEGDEYVADPGADKTPKFMYLNPKIIVCTNISYDHPDVYKSLKEVINVYASFFKKTIENGGKVILSWQASEKFRKLPSWEVYETGDAIRDKIRRVLRVPGEYNVRNAMAAMAVAKELGISEEEALAGLGKYTGAKRRFELIGEIGGISLYDDYAHHPTEIRVLWEAAREKFPGKRIRFVFQPHTFSRTNALFSEFANSLKPVDEVIMFPIFASARETLDETVSSKMLADEINRRGGRAVSVADGRKLVEYLTRTAKPNEIIFTVGAGNLYEIHQDILEGLEKKRAVG